MPSATAIPQSLEYEALGRRVAAALTLGWFLVRFRLPANPLPGIGLVLLAVVLWNLPPIGILPGAMDHLTPYIVMLACSLLYRLGTGMMPALARTAQI